MSTGSQFIAVLILFLVAGAMALWSFHDWRERERAADRDDMERWAEPSSFGRTHDYGRDDELTEPPLLPEDYRAWNAKR